MFCSNEEVYVCHDGNNAVDRVMNKCGELIKLKPQKVMENIAQYRYVYFVNANDTSMCDTCKAIILYKTCTGGMLRL